MSRSPRPEREVVSSRLLLISRRMCKQVSPDPSGQEKKSRNRKVCTVCIHQGLGVCVRVCVCPLWGHVPEAFTSQTSAAQRQPATTRLIGYLLMQSGSEASGPSGLTLWPLWGLNTASLNVKVSLLTLGLIVSLHVSSHLTFITPALFFSLLFGFT